MSLSTRNFIHDLPMGARTPPPPQQHNARPHETNTFVELYERLGTQSWKVRVIEPSSPRDPYYLFLAMRHPYGVSYQDYRQARRHCLEEYPQAVKVRSPEAKDIVGIGTGPPEDEDSAEDLLYLDARE
jgi:hypothetical protein